MDYTLTFALFAAAVGLVVGIYGVWVNFMQWKGIRTAVSTIQTAIDEWKGAGTAGEQFGEWLMSKEAEDKPTNLQIAAVDIGSQIAASLRGSVMGVQSGEVRRLKAIEGKVLEALEPDSPELKLARGIMERVGIEESDLGAVVAVLQKYAGFKGGLPSLATNNNGGEVRNRFGFE